TYFNAFPASYWRRWTVLESVVLRVEVRGDCRIDVYRSKADGSRIHVEGRDARDGLPSDSSAASAGAHAVRDDAPDGRIVEFTVSLAPFEDGGWIWFDITTATKVDV